MTVFVLLVFAAIIFASGFSGCLTFVVVSGLLLLAGSYMGGFGALLAFLGIGGLAIYTIFGGRG